MNNEKEEKPWYKKLSWIVGIIACCFVIGSFVLYWIHLPDPHNVNNKEAIGISGTFGDSFGFLTCLFSGLSSIGMIVAILMQREELKLQRDELQENREVLKQQREEFEKSSKAQRDSVTLTALMALIKKTEIEIESTKTNLKKIPNMIDSSLSDPRIYLKQRGEIEDVLADLIIKRNKMFRKIETILDLNELTSSNTQE